jgi:hypothetical protein
MAMRLWISFHVQLSTVDCLLIHDALLLILLIKLQAIM